MTSMWNSIDTLSKITSISGWTASIFTVIVAFAGLMYFVAGNRRSVLEQNAQTIATAQLRKDVRTRKTPQWTPLTKVKTLGLPPSDSPYYVELEYKLWTDDNNITPMIRIAAEANGDFDKTSTGSAGIIRQLINKNQTFYFSLSDPSLKCEINLKGFQDPFRKDVWTEFAKRIYLSPRS